VKNILSSQITRDIGALSDAQQHEVLRSRNATSQ